ncbi:MAG: superinfection immunity protein [Mycobacteriales bacterium]
MMPIPIHRFEPVAGLVFAALLLVYLTPTLVAVSRDEPRSGQIARVNLLYGWTFVGWVVALTMALSRRVSR